MTSDDGIAWLARDNFTPPSRTPWGGHRIRALKGLAASEDVVGESWELAMGPPFPSRTEEGEALHALVDREGRARWLGDESAAGSALLVKLLDAGAALSVQIHPPEGHPRLGPDESGKPEAWYVVEADPGAGIYLGLTEEASEQAVRACLERGGDLSKLLRFVAVEPGDLFVVRPGTPHCIGAGVFVVEPQVVAPGKRGITYRYWDWNRTVDGAPRALQVEEALEVTDWAAPRGLDGLDMVRARLGGPRREARLEEIAGPAAAVHPAAVHPAAVRTDAMRIARISGTGALSLPRYGTLTAVVVLDGVVEIGARTVARGSTVAIAAERDDLSVRLRGAHAIVTAAVAR